MPRVSLWLSLLVLLNYYRGCYYYDTMIAAIVNGSNNNEASLFCVQFVVHFWLSFVVLKCIIIIITTVDYYKYDTVITGCLSGGKSRGYQNCSVLYCVLKLCTVISTLR